MSLPSKVATFLANMPIIGPLIRVAVAVWQLPETRNSIQIQMQALQNSELPALRASIVDMGRQQEELFERVRCGDQSTQYAVERVEFVRRELMYEMRYGARETKDPDNQLRISARIISKDKLEAARSDSGELRLNLGCGHIPMEGYLNVDRRPLDGVDIVAEVDSLPIETGEADEIFSAHLLEHFPQEQLLREVLPHWKDRLRPGGVLRAVVPDADAMLRGYSNGSFSYPQLREVTFGAQDYDGDFHYNMFTPESLGELLIGAGFADVQVVDRSRKNGACLEFEILAHKKV